MRTKAKLKGWMAVALSLLVFSTAVAAPSPADASVAAPQGVVGRDNDGEVLITWEAVTGAAGYNIYRNNGYVGTEHDLDFVESVSEGTYSYYVTAFDAGGQNFSPRSGETSVTVGTDSSNPPPSNPSPSEPPAAEREPTPQPSTGPIETPVITSAVLNSSGTVLEWERLQDSRVVGVNIYGGTRYLTTINQPTNSWVDPDGERDLEYYLVAFDANGNNFSPTSEVMATVEAGGSAEPTEEREAPTGELGAPTVHQAIWGGQSVQVSWTFDDSRVAGFNIYRDD